MENYDSDFDSLSDEPEIEEDIESAETSAQELRAQLCAKLTIFSYGSTDTTACASWRDDCVSGLQLCETLSLHVPKTIAVPPPLPAHSLLMETLLIASGAPADNKIGALGDTRRPWSNRPFLRQKLDDATLKRLLADVCTIHSNDQRLAVELQALSEMTTRGLSALETLAVVHWALASKSSNQTERRLRNVSFTYGGQSVPVHAPRTVLAVAEAVAAHKLGAQARASLADFCWNGRRHAALTQAPSEQFSLLGDFFELFTPVGEKDDRPHPE